ncbi:chromosomal replication initiator protein DnaA [Roseibacillus ishigakijimensis]|uniref:Chromosomal replication initiator protein DnaA n=1 Tax=Roseibacillus ishigakijimensis TaxID=454146 RepID=A0A934RL76_9BACT|nr:chromosomal replication initiator protein DnaA [Roseibacillus ishigakijimensis]MBK1832795.1 chromosomal replication initiator protein DnaA [Roseibacillus ishigakijimensis]
MLSLNPHSEVPDVNVTPRPDFSGEGQAAPREREGEGNAEALWSQIAPELRTLVRENVFDRWFAEARLEEEEDGTRVLTVPSDTHCLWIETNYMPELCAALGTVLDPALAHQVRVRSESEVSLGGRTVGPEGGASRGKAAREAVSPRDGLGEEEDSLKRLIKKARLNPDNTFERFVVGSSNEFAHAACYAVAQGKGQAYNPLFLHGGSGMGKTHLAQALGQEILRTSPKTRVQYLTCEQFTNEFIDAVQKGSLSRFRANYRKAEVLIVDDIQFLRGKEKTGDEFFHTFNALLDLQAQIILTSDRPACEIQSLEPRLMTRFESGLTVALEPPSLEMRVAILQKKLEEWKATIPHDILVYIAERVRSSVRRLEGALVRVATFTSLGNGDLSVSRVDHLLRDILREEASSKVTIDAIQRKVAEYFDLRVADMTGRRRPKNIAHARQVAMYLSRTMTKNSLVEIGDAFGGRDHGTIIHAVKKVKGLMESEEETREAIEHLAASLNR